MPWGVFLTWYEQCSYLVSLYAMLLCDIQLPFGRHHIHGDLLAPTWGKFDCYWHVFFTPCTFYPMQFRSRLVISALFRPLIKSFYFYAITKTTDDRTSHASRVQAWAIYPTLLAWCRIHITTEWFFLHTNHKHEGNKHESCAENKDTVQ